MIFPCSIVLRFYAPVLKPSILFLCQAPKRFMLSSPFTVKFSSFYSLFSFARGASHNKVWAVKMIWQCFPNINYRVHQPHTTSPSHTCQKPSLKHMVCSLPDHRSELKKNTSGYILCTCGGNSLAMLFWISLAIFLALWEYYHHLSLSQRHFH